MPGKVRSDTTPTARRDGSCVMDECTQHGLRRGVFSLAGLLLLSLLVPSNLFLQTTGSAVF